MIADLMTKAVSREVHETLIEYLFGWNNDIKTVETEKQAVAGC